MRTAMDKDGLRGLRAVVAYAEDEAAALDLDLVAHILGVARLAVEEALAEGPLDATPPGIAARLN